ncbi:pentatricopeptide repeat-containing protein, chloroplastic [Cinnamomum micranthum f. kanehirae]|uniref:Pentatricopeptide repeat-containing protein, chloroplastic n=1 Tax=Cinnamomum micranthum f. kanehirae TaxID=337451 RepID=A0A443NJ38_9MAGN|nr:pentatricopeptide repeat-containing protein, chloroplastic [Cinnamomum micranthum f. kanehirae]
MATIFNSSDWSSFSPIPSLKSFSKTPISIPTLPFVSLPSPNRRLFLASSSQSQSPLLEDASDELRISDFHPEFPIPQQSLQSNGSNLNQMIINLCKDDYKVEGPAFESYQKAKTKPNFRPDPEMLKFLIRLIGNCIKARKFKITKSLLGVLESEGEIAVSAIQSAMRSYNKLHMYSSTISVYERMKDIGILPDQECYCQIMEAYHKVGDVEKVVSLFSEFEQRKLEPPVQIYAILCNSLGKSGRAFEALKYFREMTEKGITPDSSFYLYLISSFASIREVKAAEDLFEEARDKGMLKDPVIFLKLILMYVEEGLIEKTRETVIIMREMKFRASDCILCAVINGYAKRRALGAAIKVYKELVSLGCEPGQVTYASIINVYCRLGLYREAEMTFFEMGKKGFDRCVVAYSNMISMYGKNGKLREAMRLVAKMKEKGCSPNVWVYNSLIDMHGRAMNLKQVEKLWKEMKRRKVAPDKITYTSTISAYSKAREFEECLRYYREFKMNGGKIDRSMAGIIVGVFSKTSRIDELLNLLQDIQSEGIELDERLYKSAMNALRDAGLWVQVKWFKESFGIAKGLIDNGGTRKSYPMIAMGGDQSTL